MFLSNFFISNFLISFIFLIVFFLPIRDIRIEFTLHVKLIIIVIHPITLWTVFFILLWRRNINTGLIIIASSSIKTLFIKIITMMIIEATICQEIKTIIIIFTSTFFYFLFCMRFQWLISS